MRDVCTHGMQGTVAFQEACTVKNFKTMQLLAALGARTNAMVGGMFHFRRMYTTGTCTTVFVAGMHLRMCCNLALHPALLAFVTLVMLVLASDHTNPTASRYHMRLDPTAPSPDGSSLQQGLLLCKLVAVHMHVVGAVGARWVMIAACARSSSTMRMCALLLHATRRTSACDAHRLLCALAAAARRATLRQAMQAHRHAASPVAVHLVCHHDEDVHASFCAGDIGDRPGG